MDKITNEGIRAELCTGYCISTEEGHIFNRRENSKLEAGNVFNI
jgi:hypothetical protein